LGCKTFRMKISLPGFIFLLGGSMFLCSCSKQVFTHQQVLQSFHTKNDVQKQFGVPDEKTKGEDIEVWTYYRDTLHTVASSNKTDTIKNINTGTDILKVSQPVEHANYIKFSFDTAGNVTGYKSNGVNLSKTKRDSFGKGLLNVLAITAAITVIIGVEILNNSNLKF